MDTGAPFACVRWLARLGGLCLLCLFPSLLQAQAHGLEVRPVDQLLVKAEPRQVTTVAFRVRNDTGRAAQFEARPVLPPGWRLISPEYPFDLPAGETVVRFVSFFIPEGAEAGDYELIYAVNDRLQPAVRDSYSIAVQVRALPGLQVSTLEAPGFVISGEDYRVTFVIRNKGNVAISAGFAVSSSRGAALEPRAGAVSLAPGESRPLAVAVKSEELGENAQDWLTLTVRSTDGSLADSATVTVRLLPRVTGVEQAYHTLPSTLTLRGAVREKAGERSFAWQTEIAGAGTLDEAGEQAIAYLLRGPGLANDTILGSLDEYRFDYQGKQLGLSLGDQVYALSPLSERARYGRGGRASYQLDRWQLGTYYMRDRSSAEAGEQAAVSAGYRFDQGARVDLNYLQKRGEVAGDILSLRGQTAWRPGHGLDLEVARSEHGAEQGQALWGHFGGAIQALRYRLSLMHADPDYAGYYRDQQFAHLGLDYALTEQWGLRGSVQLQRDNLALDPARKAPDDRQLILGSDYRVSADTRLGFDYRLRMRRDRRPLPEFDARSQSARVSLGQQFGSLSMYAIGDWGQNRDQLSGDRFGTALYLVSAMWQAAPGQSYSAYFFYDDNAFSTERQPVQKTVGVNAHVQVSTASAVELNLQHQPDSGGHSYTANAAFSHVQASGRRLALNIRRTTGATAQTDVMLTYTVPFAVPAGRRRNVATLNGRIYDAETGAGLPNVVLNLGGLIAVSDQTGLFTFPSVKVGTHYLSIDRADSELDKVSTTRLPAEVEVVSEGDNRVDIALVRAATLGGRVLVYEAEDIVLPVGAAAADERADIDGAARAQPLPAHGLQEALVILRSGERTYKRLTDRGGGFRIAGVPPGQWTVSIAGDGLPADLELEQGQFVLDLQPGTTAEIEFKLMPKVRRLKMLEPLDAIQI